MTPDPAARSRLYVLEERDKVDGKVRPILSCVPERPHSGHLAVKPREVADDSSDPPVIDDRRAIAEVGLGFLELRGRRSEFLRRGIKPGAPQDSFGAEDLGAAVLEGVVCGEIPDKKNYDRRGDNDAEAGDDP